MNRTKITRATRLALGLAVLAALAATPSFAQTTIDLCATTGTAEVVTGVNVPIWGFVLGSTCTPGDATLPNPVIRATAGETLTINLTNELGNGESVSFFVPGLPNPAPAGLERFTAEVADGGTAAYAFTNVRAGTFLYHSATDKIRTQVPMGLYGALVVDSAPGEAYPGVSYDQDEVLVYSAIDPALNADPAGSTGARVAKSDDRYAEGWTATESGWNPQYFLINGKAFPNTLPLNVTPGDGVLLRYVNAGLDSVMPTLEGGLYMSLIAEDGNRYPHPLTQYGIELPAGKTMDAMVSVDSDGQFALYDRALSLTNAGAADGGWLVYLSGAAGSEFFRLAASNYGVGEADGTVTITVDRVGGSTGAVSVDYATSGGTATAGTDYTAVSTPITLDFADAETSATFAIAVIDDPDNEGDETFNVDLSNPVGGPTIGAPASAVVTIIDDDSPGALQFNSATYIAAENGGFVTITVDRVGGSAGAVTVDYATADGTATAGSDYTAISPPATLNFIDGQTSATFGVTILPDAVNDSGETFSVNLSNATGGATIGGPAMTTVTIVEPVNIPPVGMDDLYYVTKNSTLHVAAPGVLDNDTDADGPLPLTATVVDLAANGLLGFASTGEFTYTPDTGFIGTDAFTYRAFDGTDYSALTTVTLSVGPPAVMRFSTLGGGNGNPIPGVAGPYDDADIYGWDSFDFSRSLDATAIGLPGNVDVDGLLWVSDTEFYVSFNTDGIALPGGPDADDEDVAHYLDGVWSIFFDGSVDGLDTSAGQDFDAFDIVGGVLYFSTVSGGDANPIPGVAAPYDDADIYTWQGGTFDRVFDASINDLPGNADIDGLVIVDGTRFCVSFNAANTAIPDLGSVQDEDVVCSNGGIWSLYFDGSAHGLDASNGQDVDAISIFDFPVWNSAPVAVDDPSYAVNQDEVLTVPAPGVLGNDTDFDLDALTAIMATSPANGLVVLNGADGSFTYTPNTGFFGTDTFTYTVSDGTDASLLPATVTITVHEVGTPSMVYLSTLGGGGGNSIPGVAGAHDDADIYAWDAVGTAFSRLFDATVGGLPGNVDVDGFSYVSDNEFYLSLNVDGVALPGEAGDADDEDVIHYNDGTWSLFFDGSVVGGLDTSAGQDIDAFDVVGGVLYFSTLGGGTANPIPGVGGAFDDADIYSWDGVTFAREFDGNVDGGLPGNADIDGLAYIDGTRFDVSFNATSVVVPGLGAVQDEDIVSYNNGNWTIVFVGADHGLDASAGRDLDAIDVVY